MNKFKIKPPTHWLRFFKDVFIISDWSLDSLNEILNEVNKIDHNMQITFEVKQNNKSRDLFI